MKRVSIDMDKIKDWQSFHMVFKEVIGFPDFYGNSMDAWIDCMSYLSEPDSEMTKIVIEKDEVLILELENVKSFKQRCPEQYEALIESTAFVNWRLIQKGIYPTLTLSFYD